MGRANPGILVYFDIGPLLQDLTDQEIGQIFKAMLVYGKTGEVPSFGDRAVKTVWNRVQDMVDQDIAHYSEKKLAGEYAAYCKKTKQNGEDAAPFDMWKDYKDIQNEPP